MIIEQLVNIVQSNALINIDFADLLAIFNTHGKFSMGIASGSDDQDLASLVKQAVNHPLVEPLDNYTADGIVIYIEAGEDFDLDTLTKASDYAAHISHEKTEIIMGFNCSPGMQAIKVTILVAGIKPKAPPSTLISFAARKGV